MVVKKCGQVKLTVVGGSIQLTRSIFCSVLYHEEYPRLNGHL